MVLPRAKPVKFRLFSPFILEMPNHVTQQQNTACECRLITTLSEIQTHPSEPLPFQKQQQQLYQGDK